MYCATQNLKSKNCADVTQYSEATLITMISKILFLSLTFAELPCDCEYGTCSHGILQFHSKTLKLFLTSD